VWSKAGDKIVYSSTPTRSSGVNLRLINPFDPKTDHLLAQSSGTYFKAYDWSPDDKQIVYCDFSSNTASTLWLIDASTGSKLLLSPKSSQPEFYDFPQFAKDGKGVYVVTDHDSDFRKLAYIDLTSHKISYVPSGEKRDVEEFQVAPNGKNIAFITNQDGASRSSQVPPNQQTPSFESVLLAHCAIRQCPSASRRQTSKQQSLHGA
jgi:Tol biopolymer transport system component